MNNRTYRIRHFVISSYQSLLIYFCSSAVIVYFHSVYFWYRAIYDV